MYQQFVKSCTGSGWLNANGKSIGRIQRIIDLSFISYTFFAFQPGSIWSTPYINIPTVYIVIALTAYMLPKTDIYKSYRHKSLNRLVESITSVWISVVCLIVLSVFLNKSSAEYSRLAIASWSIISWIWLIFFHIVVRLYLRKLREIGANSRTILYWGDINGAISLSDQLSRDRWLGYRIVAWFSPLKLEVEQLSPNMPRYKGGVDELKNWLESNQVDCIAFSRLSNELNSEEEETLIKLFGNTCSRVLFIPDWERKTMNFRVDSIGERTCMEIWGAKQNYDDIIIKRLFDLTLAITGVLILLPVVIVISAAIKLTSRGPILFKQKRCGLDGKIFECYKFRSMYVENCDNGVNLRQA